MSLWSRVLKFRNRTSRPLKELAVQLRMASSNKDDVETPPQVVVVGTVVGQPQPAVVQAQVVVGTAVAAYPQQDLPSLLPYPDDKRFHHNICDRICDCGAEWWLTVCCPCVSLAHISSRLRAIDPSLNASSFSCILYSGLALWVLDRILSIVGAPTNFLSLFVFVMACQLRGLTRRALHMSENPFEDCCCAFWCNCCTIQQMVGSLFRNPHERPGCQWADSPHTV